MIQTNFFKKHFDSLRVGARIKGDADNRKTLHCQRIAEMSLSSESDESIQKIRLSFFDFFLYMNIVFSAHLSIFIIYTCVYEL